MIIDQSYSYSYVYAYVYCVCLCMSTFTGMCMHRGMRGVVVHLCGGGGKVCMCVGECKLVVAGSTYLWVGICPLAAPSM